LALVGSVDFWPEAEAEAGAEPGEGCLGAATPAVATAATAGAAAGTAAAGTAATAAAATAVSSPLPLAARPLLREGVGLASGGAVAAAAAAGTGAGTGAAAAGEGMAAASDPVETADALEFARPLLVRALLEAEAGAVAGEEAGDGEGAGEAVVVAAVGFPLSPSSPSLALRFLPFVGVFFTGLALAAAAAPAAPAPVSLVLRRVGGIVCVSVCPNTLLSNSPILLISLTKMPMK
jgi:hypothetical protein